ncbi:hypothetical protein FJT64_013334 [Amphibalanus amphitrite]|uniref:Apple domain-containing protein n=1 Tax=Amphibalanus amphitrite TaxID=1232801 RepID=A0A6A4V0M4_AMPAM|nr:hypothetical protein FJT64_013334 [Amphibalanus amphitrite]
MSGSSCSCCALCYQLDTCASFSYNAEARQCQLYDSVAGYGTFLPDTESKWEYFVKPGRSQHHQFCRWDSDCRAAGDACRGRVCTHLDAVTCRVIHETFGAGERFGDFVQRMFGWLNGTEISLACMMGEGFHGFTRVLRNQNGHADLTSQTFMEHNVHDTDVIQQSILSLEQYIRMAGNDTTYDVRVFRCDQKFMVNFQLPRNEPLLSNSSRPSVGNNTILWGHDYISFKLSPPYLTSAGPTLVSINAVNASAIEGAMVREDGQTSWPPRGILVLLMYIRE